jgi:hypothetical protein
MGKGLYRLVLGVLCLLVLFVAACDTSSHPANSGTRTQHTINTSNNGTITYSANPQDVLIRTFHGGGKVGVLEISPEISIYGDGSYILGPGVSMRKGQMSTSDLEQLLHTLVDTDSLLSFTRSQFYDLPDQNATLLQLSLNNKSYQYLYGPFGYLQESQQDLDQYKHLGQALTSIQQALNGPTQAYTSQQIALLVHQIYNPQYNPDPNQTIPSWDDHVINLVNTAIYECGPLPPDQTGPNGENGCLNFTVPQRAVLLSSSQLRSISRLLKGQQQGVFLDQQLYFSVVLRPLLPDEEVHHALAMFGSGELTYASIPLLSGPIPTPGPTP